MTWLPTTNLIQTDLLTEEQLAVLRAWPHGHEYYCGRGEWDDGKKPTWVDDCVYRGKPAPVVTSIWFNRHNHWMTGPYRTRKWADQNATPDIIDVLRIDTCNGVATAHLEGLNDE